MPTRLDGERPGPNRNNMVGVKWILSKHAPQGSESILHMKFSFSPHESVLFSLFLLLLCNSVLLCLVVTVK